MTFLKLSLCEFRVHSWGHSLEEAFLNSAYAMLDYMYDTSRVDIDETQTKSFILEGKIKAVIHYT